MILALRKIEINRCEFFWGRYRYIGHSWIDNRYFQNF